MTKDGFSSRRYVTCWAAGTRTSVLLGKELQLSKNCRKNRAKKGISDNFWSVLECTTLGETETDKERHKKTKHSGTFLKSSGSIYTVVVFKKSVNQFVSGLRCDFRVYKSDCKLQSLVQ